MKTVRLWNVKSGDSLTLIAAQVYGDPRLWRLIAEANGIDDPLRFPGEEYLNDPERPLLIPGR